MVIILVAIGDYILMVISGYFVSGYWWLLMVIILVTIGDYYINDYWWIFC
jgi:hypothetical protein